MYEMKQHKPWFDEECSQFLDQRKHAKLQSLQHPNQRSVDNRNKPTHEAGQYLRKKEKEYLKLKLMNLTLTRRPRYHRLV